jgi:type IV secretory pathway ATPase VirB11/archaellum biosynthesis ATPase
MSKAPHSTITDAGVPAEVSVAPEYNNDGVATGKTGAGATTYLNDVLARMIAKQKANKQSKVTRHD